MKRLHVHLSVDDLAKSIDFYSTLFGSSPGVMKHDYAKWLVEDPRMNFTISKRARVAGLDHLGIQVDDGDELSEISRRLSAAGNQVVEQEDTHCCYARSDKAWVHDPQGIAWETFRTREAAAGYGAGDEAVPAAAVDSSCCAASPCGAVPAAGGEAACCT